MIDNDGGEEAGHGGGEGARHGGGEGPDMAAETTGEEPALVRVIWSKTKR